MKRVFSSSLKSSNLNNHISFKLGRGQSRDHIIRVIVRKENILHITRQLEAKILFKRLILKRMSKISHVSQTHALIQVSLVL